MIAVIVGGLYSDHGAASYGIGQVSRAPAPEGMATRHAIQHEHPGTCDLYLSAIHAAVMSSSVSIA